MGFLSNILGRSTPPPQPDAGLDAPTKTKPSKSTDSTEEVQNRDGGKFFPSPHDPIPITAERVDGFFPIRHLSLSQVVAFTAFGRTEPVGEGSMLFRIGHRSETLHFLVEGSVRMDLGAGEHYEITAGTPRAGFPLCGAAEYSASAFALTDLQIIRVNRPILSQGCAPADVGQVTIDPESPLIPASVRELPLFQSFYEQYRQGSLTLPVMPDVALKIGSAIEGGAGTKEVSAILELEPAIATKVVSVANSPLYFRSKRIENCTEAVSRLGLAAVRNLVTAFYMKQAFRAQHPHIRKLMEENWKNSVYLSSICYVLGGVNKGFDPEQALLGGLMADIGAVPFLYFAENAAKGQWTAADIDAILPHVRGPVGSYLLTNWGFPSEVALIPAVVENWYFDLGKPLSLADLVIVSKLHSYIGTPQMARLPPINSIPPFSKLSNRQLTPRQSLHVIGEAKEKIEAAMKMFDD